jgi:2-phospho-L-lactate/phosphoenolpyruvate guanylyltransferase
MDTPVGNGSTGAVVALKPLRFAKSRLGTLAPSLRRRLAWCMAYDTISALAAAVDRVAIVSDQPALQARLTPLGPSVFVVAEAGAVGMNPALSHGATQLKRLGAATVLACVGDLPALDADSVRVVLAASLAHQRSFLADASGVGTTMLVARDVGLDPRFQGRSAAAHRQSGAVALDDTVLSRQVPAARRDVDTEVDLADAQRHGLGPATSALFDPDSATLGRYQVITATGDRTSDGSTMIITAEGYRGTLSPHALAYPLRQVRLGQRLHAVLAGERVLSAWL